MVRKLESRAGKGFLVDLAHLAPQLTDTHHYDLYCGHSTNNFGRMYSRVGKRVALFVFSVPTTSYKQSLKQ